MNRSGMPAWAWVLIGAGLVVPVAVLGIWFVVGANASTVTVANDTASMVRISNCNDDPLDLSPGSTGTVDVLYDDTSCTVFDIDHNYAYEGCLHLARSDAHEVRLDVRLQSGMSRANCEKGS